MEREKRRLAYFYIAPAALWLLLFMGFPIVEILKTSLYHTSYKGEVFVGAQNLYGPRWGRYFSAGAQKHSRVDGARRVDECGSGLGCCSIVESQYDYLRVDPQFVDFGLGHAAGRSGHRLEVDVQRRVRTSQCAVAVAAYRRSSRAVVDECFYGVWRCAVCPAVDGLAVYHFCIPLGFAVHSGPFVRGRHL